MRTKTAPALVKAAGPADGLADGEFIALVSVFGNKDAYGDIVVPGAYAEDIAEWKLSGDPLPVIWSHDWSDPESHIGAAKDWRELLPGDAELPEKLKPFGGLLVHGQNDVADNARAARVSKLLAGRRVKQFSFAYDELESGFGTYNGIEGWLLKRLHVFEVGPTLVGANQSTDLLGAKTMIIDLATVAAARQKAGARQPDSVAATLAEIKEALALLDEPDSATDSDTASRPGGTGQGGDGAADATEEPTPTLAADDAALRQQLDDASLMLVLAAAGDIDD
jgi:HK97 family phage prohead protease